MAEQNDKLDFSQPKNTLSEIAERERARLFPRNDALADGDDEGRGTGVFLDIHNLGGGTTTDINERNSEIKINKYNYKNGYKVEE